MFIRFVLFTIIFVFTSQEIAYITYSKPPCIDPYDKKIIPTSKCLPNGSIFQCTNNSAIISENCNQDCSSCTSISQGKFKFIKILVALDTCNTTTGISSYSCKDLSILNVGDVGFIYERYSTPDCLGQPLFKGYQFGGLCFSKKTLLCQDKYVKEYSFKTNDCKEEDPTSSIKYTLGNCVKDSDGNFIKVLRCSNEPWFPIWAIIVTSISGSVILGGIFIIGIIIWFYWNCIRKGGYYNPIIDGEDEIIVSKGMKYEEI